MNHRASRRLPITLALTLVFALSLALLASCSGGSGESSSPAASDGAASGLSSPSASSDAANPGKLASSESEQGDPSSTSSKQGSSDGHHSDSDLAKRLRADVKPIVKKSGMDVGVCIIDLQSGSYASIDGKKRMVSASMIKLAVAASFLERVEAGKYSLKENYTLKDADIVGGTGSLGGRGAGARVTYGELLEKMISESDNTATNALIGTIGMNAVNETAANLGLSATKLNRLMMDEEAIAKGKENYTSANDIATILELAYKGELVNAKMSRTLVAALEKQTDDTGILAGLPSNVKFAHKTGSLGRAQNDGGIVMTGANANSGGKADAKSGAKANAKADATSDAKADAKSDAASGAKPDTKADTKSDAASDATSDAASDKSPASSKSAASTGHDFIIAVMCGGDGYSLDGALEAMSSIGTVAYRDIVG